MPTLETLIRQAFDPFIAKDLPAVMALFAEDAVVIDPNYPQPIMRGKLAIEQGFAWAFGNLEQPGFTILHSWIDAQQSSGAIEIAADHRFRGGLRARFTQVFVIETRDGLITRLQSFPSYGPHGLPAAITNITRFVWRLRGKLR